MITVNQESFASTMEEMKALNDVHHKEIGNFIEKMPLDPDYEQYLLLEKHGLLLNMVVRDEGKIVGYYIGLIKGGLHYRSTLTHICDIFYIDPQHRGHGSIVGKLLFDAVKKESIRRGVKLWRVSGKIGSAALNFLEKLGFKHVEIVYAMWLGE